MPTQPLHAPPALREAVLEHLDIQGIKPHKTSAKVFPFVEINPNPNKFTPEGEPRWVAKCPECPGREVVPAEDDFMCGSCGAVAEVDWSS